MYLKLLNESEEPQKKRSRFIVDGKFSPEAFERFYSFNPNPETYNDEEKAAAIEYYKLAKEEPWNLAPRNRVRILSSLTRTGGFYALINAILGYETSRTTLASLAAIGGIFKWMRLFNDRERRLTNIKNTLKVD